MYQNILFIVNPISGGGKNRNFVHRIQRYMKLEDYAANVVYSNAPGHAHEIAKANCNIYKTIVAVGGDGTINEVGKALIGTNTKLGIIPTGSGNGLGNFLQIPKRLPAALKVVIEGNTKCIDTGLINEHVFLNVCGVGFDGRISSVFAQSVKRGLPNYIRSIIHEIVHYKPQYISITLPDEEISEEVFLVSFANSSQYGNNFKVTKGAQIDDGLLNMTIVLPFTPAEAIPIGVKFAAHALDEAPRTMSKTITSAELKADLSMEAHVDGEPLKLGTEAMVKVVPKSLWVITPKAETELSLINRLKQNINNFQIK